jgi:peptidoglycan hydrolase CwlO-like protein
MTSTVPEPPHQPRPTVTGTPPPEEPKKRRPWAWIVACTLLFVVALAFGVWALSLNGNLNDEKDKSAALEQQNAQTQEDVQAVSDEVDQLGQTVNDAGDQLAQAGQDAQQGAEDAISGVQGKLAELKARIQDALDKLKQSAQGAATATPSPSGG